VIRLTFLLLLSLFLAIGAYASPNQQPQETEEPETEINAGFVPGHRSSGPLPIDLVHGTRLYVPALVNGLKTSVLLDTGAAWTVLDRRFAEALGLKPEGYRTTRGTGGTAPSQYAYGVSIDLGHLQLRNVTVLVMDLSDVERRLGIALPVIVGPEAFSTVVADLDLPQRRVTFWKRDSWRVPAGAVPIPAKPAEGLRTIPLKIEDRPEALFLFDIGNGTTPLKLSPHYWAEQDLLSRRRTGTVMSGAIGGERPVPVARLGKVRFARWTVTDVPAQFAPDDGSTASSRAFAGNVGMPLLGRFRLITDFAADVIWVLPGKTVSKEFERDRSGIAFSRSPEGLTVRALAGPALQSGLVVGDRIVAVRKPGTSWLAVNEARNWNTGRSGSIVRLRLASGKVKELTLKDYF